MCAAGMVSALVRPGNWTTGREPYQAGARRSLAYWAASQIWIRGEEPSLTGSESFHTMFAKLGMARRIRVEARHTIMSKDARR